MSEYDKMVARIKAADTLHGWGISDDDFNYHNSRAYRHLATLLGYSSRDDWIAHMTDEDVSTLGLLAGPNGWAIYKMLLVRKGLNAEQV